jgi:hypothetical protein
VARCTARSAEMLSPAFLDQTFQHPGQSAWIDERRHTLFVEYFDTEKVLTVQDERFHGRRAMVMDFDRTRDRLVAWIIPGGAQILVSPESVKPEPPPLAWHECLYAPEPTGSWPRLPGPRDTYEGPGGGGGSADGGAGGGGGGTDSGSDELKCGICQRNPARSCPITLPCTHRFCGFCVGHLRFLRGKNPAWLPAGARWAHCACPSCGTPIGDLLTIVVKGISKIIAAMRTADSRCSDPACLAAGRHKAGAYVGDEPSLNTFVQVRVN